MSDVRTVVIRIEVEDPGGAEARALISALDDYLNGLYPAERNHLLSVEALQRPNVTFLVLRVDGRASGCGAFVDHGEYGEVKRMFVTSEHRGARLGGRLLEELEQRMRIAGLAIARLETGIHQPEALRVYERAGYAVRGPFGEYPDDDTSVFLEKTL